MDADDISSVEKEKEELNALLFFFLCFDVAKLRSRQEIWLALFKCGRSLFLILFFLRNIFIFFQFFRIRFQWVMNILPILKFSKNFSISKIISIGSVFLLLLFFLFKMDEWNKMILETFSLA